MHLAPLAATALALLLGGRLLLRLVRDRRAHSLAGQLVLVTGAGGGLGRALALAFARQGAVVALWDVREAALAEVCGWLLREHGVDPGALHAARVDVGDASQVAAAAERLVCAHGAVRVVVSNAGVARGQRVLEASERSLRASLDANLLSHFWCARAFLPHMLAPPAAGVFVTVGSLMGALPAARLADYCAAKAGLAQLHECLRWELRARRAPRDVSCLHVQPYLIDTPLFEGAAFRTGWLHRLLPALTPDAVAERVVWAVRTRRERLVVPAYLDWLPPLLALLPAALRDAALGLAGAGGAMEGFVGREVTASSS